MLIFFISSHDYFPPEEFRQTPLLSDPHQSLPFIRVSPASNTDTGPLAINNKVSLLTELYPNSADIADYVCTYEETISQPENLMANPWAPFISEEHFNFAAFLKRIKFPAAEIDALFKVKMPFDASLLHSFRSAYTLNSLIDKISDGLGWQSWIQAQCSLQWTDSSPPIVFYHRNPSECAQWLLKQRVFGSKWLYEPVREYSYGIRQYHDINTANWWWETQVCISSTHY